MYKNNHWHTVLLPTYFPGKTYVNFIVVLGDMVTPAALKLCAWLQVMVSHNAMLGNPKRQRQSQTKTNVCKLLMKQQNISSTKNLNT